MMFVLYGTREKLIVIEKIQLKFKLEILKMIND